jgi:hypothetical protein
MIVSFSVNAQSEQKLKTAVYEYISAEYNTASGLITISAKDESGESYTFHFSEKDNIKNTDLLYSRFTSQQTMNTTIYTRAELVGKKIQIAAIPVGELDPASPYCCYLIKEISVL